MKTIHVYRLTDEYTHKVYLEGTAEALSEYGYTKSSIAGAARTKRLFMGKYRVSVVGEVPKIYKNKPKPKPRSEAKKYKKPKSNLNVMQEINKKAAVEGLSYGQYQSQQRKTKVTYDPNRGVWKEISIG